MAVNPFFVRCLKLVTDISVMLLTE